MVWNSREQLENQDIQNLSIRAEIFDQWGKGTGDTIIIHLDNNYPPVVNFDEHPQEINGEASFQFEVLNPEQSDFLSLVDFILQMMD